MALGKKHTCHHSIIFTVRNSTTSSTFTLTSSYVQPLRNISHLWRCEEGKSRKTAHPPTFDLGEELEACEIHGIHVRGGPAWAENTITLCPTNKLPQTSQHFVFHQHKHWSHLVGVASNVTEVKCSGYSSTNHQSLLNAEEFHSHRFVLRASERNLPAREW